MFFVKKAIDSLCKCVCVQRFERKVNVDIFSNTSDRFFLARRLNCGVYIFNMLNYKDFFSDSLDDGVDVLCYLNLYS
uniref:Uncharacterized protein n=1 Tax=Candidatus Kentrum sp. FM TaxID=2126340 RepID=A0A450TWW9_9GAMM|nr:MAG: hypothetical protein BECKFM1743C_GA0114222_105305 [Candidatus Kentron sp. FM]VFJ73479.1 MAG: hypothetical protein BECKFM1743A_GA0114220_107232 [Candidatus Kentron sp. FM]VFK20539.1 MAG: hypothetical protein BECKFM1743B_GA0114221_107042 [Candidatus Kentron sp. FM]